MKNLYKLFGIITLIAIIGFSFVACGPGADGDDDDTYTPPPIILFPDNLVGKWENTSYIINIENRNGSSGHLFVLNGPLATIASYSYRLKSIEGDVYTLTRDDYTDTYELTIGTDGKLTVANATSSGEFEFVGNVNGTYTRVVE